MLDSLQIDPIAFTIPIGDGFPIYWYGILITVGIALGVWWAAREINRRGGDEDAFYTGVLLVVISGYVFARIWYVVQEMMAGRGEQYTSLLDLINIREGGVNILGGFIGAALVGYWFLRRNRLNFWDYADVVGPALLLAQGIGRWGNFINQELYGPPTDLPWGILIGARNRITPYANLVEFPETTRFHPTFLYESLWLLLGFVLLVILNRRFRDQWKPGTLFGLFMVWWGGGRTWVELFRPDQPAFGDGFITYSMVVAFLLALTGIYILLYLYNRLPPGFPGAPRRRRRVRKPRPRRD